MESWVKRNSCLIYWHIFVWSFVWKKTKKNTRAHRYPHLCLHTYIHTYILYAHTCIYLGSSTVVGYGRGYTLPKVFLFLKMGRVPALLLCELHKIFCWWVMGDQVIWKERPLGPPITWNVCFSIVSGIKLPGECAWISTYIREKISWKPYEA